MGNCSLKGTVIWSIDKYDIQLQLFVNEKATELALLQWSPSNAREQRDYDEMKEHFEKNPLMNLCANNEDEILIENNNIFHLDNSNIEFRKDAEFTDDYSHQYLYLYEKLDTLNGNVNNPVVLRVL